MSELDIDGKVAVVRCQEGAWPKPDTMAGETPTGSTGLGGLRRDSASDRDGCEQSAHIEELSASTERVLESWLAPASGDIPAQESVRAFLRSDEQK